MKITCIEKKKRFFAKCGYYPHEMQLKAHSASNKFVVVAAGARGGKSMLAGAEIALRLMLPNQTVWCVSSQYELADKEFSWALDFLGKLPFRGRKAIDFFKCSTPSKGTRIIKSPWGSVCQTKSTEKPSSLLGESVSTIVLGEASQIKREPWDRMLEMRMSDQPDAQVYAISTPNADAGLFYDFYLKGQDPKNEEFFSIKYSTWDNPTISRDVLADNEARMDDKVYQEQVLGEFVSRRGAVWSVNGENFVDSLPDEWRNWPLVVGVRPNQNNPFAVECVAFDRKNMVYYVFDEYCETHADVKDVKEFIVSRTRGLHMRGVIAYYFSSVMNAELKKAGIGYTCVDAEKTLNKNNSEIKRIQMMQNLLKVYESGKTRIKVVKKNCPALVESLTKTTWPDSRGDRGRLDSELPLDRYLAPFQAVSSAILFIERTLGRA